MGVLNGLFGLLDGLLGFLGDGLECLLNGRFDFGVYFLFYLLIGRFLFLSFFLDWLCLLLGCLLRLLGAFDLLFGDASLVLLDWLLILDGLLLDLGLRLLVLLLLFLLILDLGLLLCLSEGWLLLSLLRFNCLFIFLLLVLLILSLFKCFLDNLLGGLVQKLLNLGCWLGNLLLHLGLDLLLALMERGVGSSICLGSCVGFGVNLALPLPGGFIVSTILLCLLLLVEVVIDLLLLFDVDDDLGWDGLVGGVRGSVLNGILVAGGGIFFVSVEVSLIVVAEVPGVVADNVWDDLGVSLNSILVEGFLDAHELKLSLLLGVE